MPCNASNLAGLDVEGVGQWILVGFFGLVGFCFFFIIESFFELRGSML